MLALAIGTVILFAFLGGLRAFERASVGSIKLLFAWVLGLGGLTLALMLVLTGREGGALAAMTLLGPLAMEKWRGSGMGARFTAASRAKPASGSMTRAEAASILGVRPGASEADIRAAYMRLMRAAHPDGGGSDWVAARVNQARDVLLGRKRG